MVSPLDKIKEVFKCKDERVTINVDADVITQGAVRLSVVEIVPDEISMEFVKKAVDVLMEGKKVYEPRAQLSKTEIEAEILGLEQALADPKNSDSDGLRSGDPDTVKEVTKMFKDRIESYKRLRKDAPDEYIPKEAVYEFKPKKYYTNKQWYEEDMADFSNDDDEDTKEMMREYEYEKQIILDTQLDNDYYGRVKVSSFTGKFRVWSDFEFCKSHNLDGLLSPEPEFDEKKKVTISKEEAAKKCKAIIAKLGLDDMVLTCILPCTEGGETTAEVDEFDGYTATFQRAYGGISTLDSRWGIVSEDIETYGPSFYREYITIKTYGDDIQSIHWQNPVKQTKVENENVAILTFEEIMEKFKKNTSLMYNMEGTADEEETKDIEIKVIKLGMTRIKCQIS